MPVIRVARPPGKTDFTDDRDGRGVDVWLATCDRADEPRLDVLTSDLLPRVWGQVPDEPGLYYGEGRQARQTDAPRVWEVRCPVFRHLEGPPKGPLEEWAEITRRDELFESPVDEWADGTPARTAAGEWIPGITRRKVRSVFAVNVNLGFEPPWWEALAGRVNAAPVRLRGVPLAARTLQFVPKGWGRWDERNFQRFFVASFELHYQQEGFRRRFVHRGFKAIDYRPGRTDEEGRPLPPRVYRIEDDGGEIEEAFPLDERGRAWREPDPDADPEADANDDLTRPLARELSEEQFARSILERDVELTADFGVIPRTFA